MIRFASTLHGAADFVSLFREGLRLSKVHEDEIILIYSDTLTSPQYPAALLAAARDLGAQAVQIVQPIVPYNLGFGGQRAAPTELIRDAMIAADMVVDISSVGMLYSNEQNHILKTGTRILRVREPEDCLMRLMPSSEVRDRSLRGEKRLQSARRLRVVSDGGTDLHMEKGEREVSIQYGMADEPGRWDHWPTGMVNTTAVEETVEGTLVIEPASVIFPFGVYVSQPLTLHFKKGIAESIDGGREAIMLRDYISTANDVNCRRVSHIGWGTEHRARWDTLATRGAEGGGGAEIRSIYGNVLIALGENRDLGGENAAPLHIDISLRNSRLELDGSPILDSGRFLDQALA